MFEYTGHVQNVHELHRIRADIATVVAIEESGA